MLEKVTVLGVGLIWLGCLVVVTVSGLKIKNTNTIIFTRRVGGTSIGSSIGSSPYRISQKCSSSVLRLKDRDDDIDEEEDDDDDDDDFDADFERLWNKRKDGDKDDSSSSSSSFSSSSSSSSSSHPPSKKRTKKKKEKVPAFFNGMGPNRDVFSKAVFAGLFIAGIGTGITIDSAINTNPKDLASRDAIDRNAPNPKLCLTYGSSAMVLDQRVFVTFNPFNVFVTQADAKPGCVLRPSNVVDQLQKQRSLLTDADIEGCKNGYNTWAFIGDINNKPQLNCVFQSDDAQNEFLSNPKVGLGEDVYDDNNPVAPGPGTVGSITKFNSAIDSSKILDLRNPKDK